MPKTKDMGELLFQFVLGQDYARNESDRREALKLFREASERQTLLSLNVVIDGDKVVIQSLKVPDSKDSTDSDLQTFPVHPCKPSEPQPDPYSPEQKQRRKELIAKLNRGQTPESALLRLRKFCESDLNR